MDSDNNQNNREFTRVSIKVEATLEFEGVIIDANDIRIPGTLKY